MPVYQKDVCPRCQADVSRRFGLILSPTINCRACQLPLRVTALAVMNNWQFNFAAPVVATLWVGAVAIIFRKPEMVEQWARDLGATPSGHPLQDHLAMSLLAGVVALFCSIPFAVVGRLVGFFVARQFLSAPGSGAASNSGQRPFQYGWLTPAGREETPRAATPRFSPAEYDATPPQTGSGGFRFIARAFFGLLWATIFFFGSAFVMSAVVIAGVTDPQLRTQASRHAGQTWGVWLFLGSIGLAITLGGLGVLPGTRSKKRQA